MVAGLPLALSDKQSGAPYICTLHPDIAIKIAR
jgi:hypothetical protein